MFAIGLLLFKTLPRVIKVDPITQKILRTILFLIDGFGLVYSYLTLNFKRKLVVCGQEFINRHCGYIIW